MLLARLSGQGPARRGAVTPLVALCLVGVIGVLAIAVDGGVLLNQRRHAQAVADAAAMAGASDLCQNYAANQGTDPKGAAKKSAQDVAKANGYPLTNITFSAPATGGVQVNIPPQSGDAKGKNGYVEVLVKYNESRSFSNIFASGPLPVNARSVATGRVITKAKAGILLLDPTGQGALQDSGIALGVMGAPVVLNSKSSQAITVTGAGSLSAPAFYTAGGAPGYSLSGGKASLTGPIYTGGQSAIAPMADPLANLPTPNASTMTSQSGGSISSGTQTLSPGVYHGGIQISGSSTVVNLLPGVYYMDGGGFNISGGIVTGNGVMIYNVPNGGKSDTVSISGQATINLSPPTSGTYQGLTFFQDRSSSLTATLAGGSTTNISGSFYFAGAMITITGGSTSSVGSTVLGSQYISKDLNLSGNGFITINATSVTATTQRFYGLTE